WRGPKRRDIRRRSFPWYRTPSSWRSAFPRRGDMRPGLGGLGRAFASVLVAYPVEKLGLQVAGPETRVVACALQRRGVPRSGPVPLCVCPLMGLEPIESEG